MFDDNENNIANVMGGEFNAGDHETVADFTPVPAGDYQLFIEKAEMKPTRKEDGYVLYLTMAIMDTGEFNGRKIFQRINIRNQSVQCQEIGQKMLATLGQALGLLTIASTSQLENQTVLAKVKVTKGDEQYGPQNEVTNYKPLVQSGGSLGQNTGQQTVNNQQQSQPAKQQAAGGMPWAK